MKVRITCLFLLIFVFTNISALAERPERKIATHDWSKKEGITLPKDVVTRAGDTISFLSPNQKHVCRISDSGTVAFSDDKGATWSAETQLPSTLRGTGYAVAPIEYNRVFLTFHADGRWLGAVTSFYWLQKGEEALYIIQLGNSPEGNPPTVLNKTEDNAILAWNGSSDETAGRCLRIEQGMWWNMDWNSAMIQPHAKPQPVPREQLKCQTTPPPEGALVLFDGTNLDQWKNGSNWVIRDGYAEVGKGSISTKKPLGNFRLHLEFATPATVRSGGQGRGNSGVYIMDHYEIQVLDSWENETYVTGMCGALYTQNPPLVNASLPPGEWQSYDITFAAPEFDDDQNLVHPARVTAYQNGVLIQDDFEILGRSFYTCGYLPHANRLPLLLQNHGNPVRYRNIWIVE